MEDSIVLLSWAIISQGRAMDDSPQTTSPGSAATEKPAPLWNSLEIAKFAMTVIFAVVGGLFTLFTYEQAHREKTAETNRQNELGRQAKLEKSGREASGGLA
jgi:heme/copper-type cytochrome/quinol oxidase subunit 2